MEEKEDWNICGECRGTGIALVKTQDYDKYAEGYDEGYFDETEGSYCYICEGRGWYYIYD